MGCNDEVFSVLRATAGECWAALKEARGRTLELTIGAKGLCCEGFVTVRYCYVLTRCGGSSKVLSFKVPHCGDSL